jgi:hypothetical protein
MYVIEEAIAFIYVIIAIYASIINGNRPKCVLA